MLHSIETIGGAPGERGMAFEKAGPREQLFFDPKRTRAAILTAGGLCPGTNNVIRAIVLELVHRYGVDDVLGIPFGFGGLDPAARLSEPRRLGVDDVRSIHRSGGTVLGTSRGAHAPSVMLAALRRYGIDLLFAIGGDGTMRGAHALAAEAARERAPIGVVAVPKTIDNDVPYVDKTFGFETAVTMARAAIDAAHTEATSTPGGIGLVKTMGREAGFIAAQSTLASVDVNVCLVPEVPFRLDGPNGLLAHLEDRLRRRGHAVIVVGEGCARSCDLGARTDASGNSAFGDPAVDVGPYLKRAIERHLDERGVRHSVKYIDPSYTLRGVPAEAVDSAFCAELARSAVHAGMAGRTDVLIGRLHRSFAHVPLSLVLAERKRIDPSGDLWLSVLETTGQPSFV